MVTPYVGILVNNALFASIPQGKSTHEAIPYYLQAGQELGVTPCFFRIQDVHLPKFMVHAYIPEKQGFVRKWIPLPFVIHNRAIYPDHQSYLKLEAWTKHGIQLFNRWNRYGKLYIHKLLMEDESLHPHLPHTESATAQTLAQMMKSYDSLIIKPNRSSIGRGIMKMDRIQGKWRLIYPVSLKLSNRSWKTFIFHRGIPAMLLRKIRLMPYIIQEALPLATYDERPFDLRVSVQRGAFGCWGITGVVAKVASPELFITNVAQGGQVRQLEEILLQYPLLESEAVFSQVHDFSLRIAFRLSERLPHLADLGLDIGITKEGKPLFIECNGKDQRYSFQEANMSKQWQATYSNPMAYAKYLCDRRVP